MSLESALISHNVVSVFVEADPSSEQGNQYVMNTPVSVLEYGESGEMAYVEGPDRYKGWIRARFLAPMRDLSDNPSTTIASLIADVFSSPSPESQIVTKLTTATSIALARHSSEREFTPLIMPDGTTAYVHRVHLSSTYQQSAGIAGVDRLPGLDILGMERGKLIGHLMTVVIASSLRFIGTPYLWGGVTPFGIDCSGLTQCCYKVVGIQLLRDAYMQFADNRFVEVEADKPMEDINFEPGDLIFFRSRLPQGRPISHVGIAIGDGSFIHAAGGGRGVIVTPCSDTEWSEIYVGARRLSPNANLSIDAAQ